MDIKVGCTGWGYKEWGGTFYSRTIKQRDWLSHYASIFDVTEVNTSFYHVIPKQMAQKWSNETPDPFRFSLKFPQTITHENKLDYEKSRQILNEFFSGIEPLKEKIQILVLQLPPSLQFDEAKPRLEILRKHLPHYCRYVIEGRHESWFFNESLKFLSDNDFCLTWSEIPIVENPAPITTDFVYCRIIGDRNLDQDAYNYKVRDQTPVLQKWANRLSRLNYSKIKFAWGMLNNHLEGFAPSSANSLRLLLGLEKLEFRDRKQKTVFD